MARVIAERQRRPVGQTNPALRAEDEDFRPPQLRGVPAHPHVLRPPEEVAARPLDQVVRSDGQTPRRPGLSGHNAVYVRRVGLENTSAFGHRFIPRRFRHRGLVCYKTRKLYYANNTKMAPIKCPVMPALLESGETACLHV